MDLATGSELATAGGTLILAIATFGSIRSGQRAARISERALLAGLRPLLFPTRLGDPSEKVGFGDSHYVGAGLGVLDRWRIRADGEPGADQPSPLSEFRRLTRDIYVPPNDFSFWPGALRDPSDPLFGQIHAAIEGRAQLMLEVLYGDMEGGQRTISRFTFNPVHDGGWLISLVRHFYLDREDPR